MDLQEEIGPKADRIFKKMLDAPYHGRVKYSHLSKMSPLDFPNKDHLELHKIWFNENNANFASFENNKGKVSMYGIRVREAKLCSKYLMKKEGEVGGGCQNPDCQLLHLCTRFLDERCLRCHMSHQINDEHNRQILNSEFFRKFTSDDQLKIIKLSQPQVCPFYNEDGICNHHDDCTRLHICRKFILGNCHDGLTQIIGDDEAASSLGCPLSHSLTSNHSQRLLQKFGVQNTCDDLAGVHCQILAPIKVKKVPRNDPEKIKALFESMKGIWKTRDTSHSPSPKRLQRNPITPIYWSVEFLDNWYNFDAEVDERIEKEFSDPNSFEIVVPTPKEIQKDLPDYLTLNFDEKKAHLDMSQTLNIQRVEFPDDRFVYLWYFLDADNQWTILDENPKIETAYKDNKVRACITSEEGKKFRVKFSDMSLLDRNVGNTFKVRRRPFLVH